MQKTKKEKIENWVDLIRHISDSWARKMNKPHIQEYPFVGKDFADLAHFARIYQPCGLMALWDAYLERATDWNRKDGYTVFTFTRSLPRLVDSDYKISAEIYRKKICPPELPAVAELFQTMNLSKANTPMRKGELVSLRISNLINEGQNQGNRNSECADCLQVFSKNLQP
jgi:integrase